MPSDIHSDASVTNVMIMKVLAPDPSVHHVLLGHPLHLWGISIFSLESSALTPVMQFVSALLLCLLKDLVDRMRLQILWISFFVGLSFSHSALGAEFVLF